MTTDVHEGMQGAGQCESDVGDQGSGGGWTVRDSGDPERNAEDLWEQCQPHSLSVLSQEY